MSRPLRSVVDGGAVVLLVGALALGALWLRDRTRRWEAPRWAESAFVPVRDGHRPAAAGGATWVAVVNPRCARCVITLWRLYGRWARRTPPPARLVALIVDAARPPDAATLRTLPPVPVWWDRERRWRRRWGHRRYGELIEFDAAGRHVRTLAGDQALRGPRAAAADGRPAPAMPP